MDARRVLLSRRALHAGGDVDARRAGRLKRRGNVLRIKPARQEPGLRRCERGEESPVKGYAMAAWPGCVARRLRIEKDAIRRKGLDKRKILTGGNPDGLHDRHAG